MRRYRAALGAIAVLAFAMGAPAGAHGLRGIPDTSGAIHVWEDQLPDSMSTAQVRFIARHIDGTQKVSLQTARRIRAYNPGFLVLHYRLGIGDGPVPFRIGARWESDFGTVTKHRSWFWHQGGRRVLQTQYDWYLMNPDSGWSAYWARRVLYEARLLGDDGVFADSLSVPQYLGPDSFSPPLRYFVGEQAWMARIDRFMRFERRRLQGRLWLIPNAGSWITTRDRTNYSLADGVMIEGFAEADASNFYALGDWQLQMDRILGLVRLGRIILAQSYLNASDMTARAFVLGSYLLVKRSHTFLNLDVGLEAQWFPEYGIDLGSALGSPPRSIDQLRQRNGLYERRFQHGFVAVNPGSRALSLKLAAPALLVRPVRGGALPSDAAVSGWGLREAPLSGSVTVPAHGAVVLMAAA